MDNKRMKSKALAECIACADTNIHLINPRTNNVDMRLFTQHLAKKQDVAELHVNLNALDDSSDSDNMIISNAILNTDSNSESSSAEEIVQPSTPKKDDIETAHFLSQPSKDVK